MSSYFETPLFGINNQKKKSNFKISKCKMCSIKCEKSMVIATHYNGPNDKYDCYKIDSNEKKIYFCDLICAKLYNDNVHKISYDFENYRLAFLNDSLSQNAKNIYLCCENYYFPLMIYKKIESLPPKEDKKLFRKQFAKIKSEYYSCLKSLKGFII